MALARESLGQARGPMVSTSLAGASAKDHGQSLVAPGSRRLLPQLAAPCGQFLATVCLTAAFVFLARAPVSHFSCRNICFRNMKKHEETYIYIC